MVMRFLIFLGGLFLILIFILWGSFGYDFTILNGDFQGLRIGMSKSDVATELARQGIPNVVPEVDENIVIKRASSKLLSRLQKADGICIGDNAAFELQIAFDKQDMSHVVYKSNKTDLALLGIQTSQPRKQVMERIEVILLSQDNVVVANCVLGVKSIPLQNAGLLDNENLDRFDTWFYYIPYSYSTVTLCFTDGKLVKVTYHWRPFEGP